QIFADASHHSSLTPAMPVVGYQRPRQDVIPESAIGHPVPRKAKLKAAPSLAKGRSKVASMADVVRPRNKPGAGKLTARAGTRTSRKVEVRRTDGRTHREVRQRVDRHSQPPRGAQCHGCGQRRGANGSVRAIR